MKDRIVEGVEVLCLLTIAVNTVVLCVGASHVLADTDAALKQLTKSEASLDELLTKPTGIKGSIQNLNALLVQASLAADNVRRASDSQQSYVQASLKTLNQFSAAAGQLGPAITDIDSSVKSIGTLVSNTDESVNHKVLPALTDTIGQAKTSLAATTKDVHADLAAIEILLADEDLKKVPRNLAAMTANLNSASHHADQALDYIELDLTPTKLPFWRSVLSAALSQAIGIPMKYLPQAVRVVNSASPATAAAPSK